MWRRLYEKNRSTQKKERYRNIGQRYTLLGFKIQKMNATEKIRKIMKQKNERSQTSYTFILPKS